MRRITFSLFLAGVFFMHTGIVGAGDLDREVSNASKYGFNEDRLDVLHQGMARLVEDQKRIGFVYAVARDGKLITKRAVGWQDRENQIPMADDTIFRVFSLTKPITTVAALRLMEQGRIDLADPVEKYIPAFVSPVVLTGFAEDGTPLTEPAQDSIRLVHLVTHTAGLGYAFDYPKALKVDREQVMGLNVPMAEGLNYLASIPLLFHPGTDWEYGLNIDVLGHVIELVTGKPLDAAVKDLVLDPLAMTDTGFFVPPEKRSRLVEGYDLGTAGELLRGTDRLPKSGDYLNADATMHSGGGGLTSTVSDMLRFTQMLLNKGTLEGTQLLSPATVDMMTSRQVPAEIAPIRDKYPTGSDMWRIFSGYTYGWGLNVLDDPTAAMRPATAESFMKDGLADIYFLGDRDNRLAIIMFTQYRINLTDQVPESVWDTFQTLAYQALSE
ncbi:MAG: serine hydrolase domain-containing protein [Rhodospirillaceae bacterium]